MKKKSIASRIKRSELGLKYEKIWHKLFYELPRYAQRCVIDEPTGRHASELARMVADEAEKSG